MAMAFSTATLAEGCFGKVYKEMYNGQWAAMKKIPCHVVAIKDLDREYKVYKESIHPNVVKILGPITVQANRYVIPLEFIFGEDLETTIFKPSKSKIQPISFHRSTIVLGMCEGLLHLHSKDIVHQDLKPDNIMVEHRTKRAVIIDLGLAKFFKNGLNSAMDMGNMAYSAPEVVREVNQRDQRSDVWAMGKIIAELHTMTRLHTLRVSPQTVKAALGDQPYCQAVCKMVEADPARRAHMSEVIWDIRVVAGRSHEGRRAVFPGLPGF